MIIADSWGNWNAWTYSPTRRQLSSALATEQSLVWPRVNRSLPRRDRRIAMVCIPGGGGRLFRVGCLKKGIDPPLLQQYD
jgi:hypothetical protein